MSVDKEAQIAALLAKVEAYLRDDIATDDDGFMPFAWDEVYEARRIFDNILDMKSKFPGNDSPSLVCEVWAPSLGRTHVFFEPLRLGRAATDIYQYQNDCMSAASMMAETSARITGKLQMDIQDAYTATVRTQKSNNSLLAFDALLARHGVTPEDVQVELDRIYRETNLIEPYLSRACAHFDEETRTKYHHIFDALERSEVEEQLIYWANVIDLAVSNSHDCMTTPLRKALKVAAKNLKMDKTRHQRDQFHIEPRYARVKQSA